MGLSERVVARFKRAGASGFRVFIKNPDPKAAFREAVEDAQHESGHGGYSGTIAEKDGYEVRSRDPLPHDAAHAFADKDGENNDKWGPAYAVPVSEAVQGTVKKFKVKVPAKSEWKARDETVVREALSMPGASNILKVEKVTLLKEGKLPEMTIEKGGPAGFKVVGPGTSIITHGWTASKTFTSRAEAIEAFKGTVRQTKPESGAKYEIVQFKATNTFTIGDTTKSMHLFEVEGTVTEQKATGKIIGWLFYGMASS